MDKQESPLIGGGEAARMLGVSRATLRRWTAKKIIRAAQRMPGGAYRYSLAEVQRIRADLAMK